MSEQWDQILPQNLIFSDLHKYKIAAAALQEPRWEKEEVGLRRNGYACYGGGAWKNSSGALVGGAMVVVQSSIASAVRKHEHRIGRIQLVQLEGHNGIQITFGSLLAPTDCSPEEDKLNFWRQLKDALKCIGHRKRDVLLLGGDLNGEVGKPEYLEDSPIGKWSVGNRNENGTRLVQECQLEQWFLPATFINRLSRKKWTFAGNFLVKEGSGKRTRREYDHFICSNNLKGQVEDVINYRDTLHDSA